jgi:hypothetical protein
MVLGGTKRYSAQSANIAEKNMNKPENRPLEEDSISENSEESIKFAQVKVPKDLADMFKMLLEKNSQAYPDAIRSFMRAYVQCWLDHGQIPNPIQLRSPQEMASATTHDDRIKALGNVNLEKSVMTTGDNSSATLKIGK